jgi:hypothetical protein
VIESDLLLKVTQVIEEKLSQSFKTHLIPTVAEVTNYVSSNNQQLLTQLITDIIQDSDKLDVVKEQLFKIPATELLFTNI